MACIIEALILEGFDNELRYRVFAGLLRARA